MIQRKLIKCLCVLVLPFGGIVATAHPADAADCFTKRACPTGDRATNNRNGFSCKPRVQAIWPTGGAPKPGEGNLRSPQKCGDKYKRGFDGNWDVPMNEECGGTAIGDPC